MDLLNKLRPQISHWNIDQVLQLILISQWSYHCHTVTIREKAFEKSSDSILLVDGLREAFLSLKSFLKILFGIDRVSFLVDKLKSEVAYHPHK